MTPEVDIVILSREPTGLDSRVVQGLREQVNMQMRVHRLIGERLADDPHRWETIARARNQARELGDSDWIMFLDDDVRLAPHAIRNLYLSLAARPRHAAVAANFLQEPCWQRPAKHVAMGATLFRREALRQITFRWQDKQCECLCCCEDLRKLGWEIDYIDSACAFHLHTDSDAMAEQSAAVQLAGRVLVAFNRRHLTRFRSHFLRTLRAHGNREVVTAVVYGLYPSELQQLRGCAGVEVIPLPVNGVMPPIRRLTDFERVIRDWPDETPVAYWDAGDVVFQSSLDELWKTVRQYRHKLLAVSEPRGYPDNPAVASWTLSIADPLARQSAFELFSRSPFLNSGFAAGTAAAMRGYLQAAARLRSSAALAGTTDWGDQTALNLYCHSQSDGWVEVDEGWNYCLHDRDRGEVFVRPDGRLASREGTPIYVGHGNAQSLYKLELSDRVSTQSQSVRGPSSAVGAPSTALEGHRTSMANSNCRNLVATFNFGDMWYATLTTPFMRRYAERIGADFIEYKVFHNADNYPPLASWFHIEAIRIFAAQDYYENLLLLDADQLVLPSCPNLFEGMNGAVRVVQDMGHPEVGGRFIEWCQTHVGEQPKLGDYFNAGMLAVPLSAARALQEYLAKPYPASELMHTDDQDFLNLRVTPNVPLEWLPQRFNWLAPQFEEAALQQHIVHFVGGHKGLLPSLIRQIDGQQTPART